jgi:isopenicillin-N epimerase
MLPPYSHYASNWSLDSNIAFLNHGSFGACPIPVLRKQQEYRERMEKDPVHFMVNDLEELLWRSKETLADFVGAKATDHVFVPNATTGLNVVLHNLQLKEGDEILTHSHAYGACFHALTIYAEKNKVKLVVADVPFPLQAPDEITDAFRKCISPKTRFALIDHVTSPTGIIFPVKEITRMLQEKNIELLIDGAHAPGMVDLKIDELNADYYTGNCHKWICSPKGSALLHVRKDKQKNFRPMVISHAYDKPVFERSWSSAFFWSGTSDYTPFLCVADAINFMGSVMNGWEQLRRHNHDLAINGRKMLLEALDQSSPAPESMLGSLATIPLPAAYHKTPYTFNSIHPLQQELYTKFRIQVPLMAWPRTNPKLWLRIAAQAYNSTEQINYLGHSLRELLNIE